MKLTIKKVNDLINDFGFKVESQNKNYYAYFKGKSIGQYRTLNECCRGIKKHTKGSSIGRTITNQFNHFIDEDDWCLIEL